ncbi:MAG: 4Fe-4S dicluster domain-containing protein [Chlorobi bacterium]|nr:4Fe-4S dicluster domain-containing protein [Chlorobiota bacterium]
MLRVLEIFLLIMAVLSSGFFIWAAYVSKNENEAFAFRKFLNLGILIFSISFLFILTHNALLISIIVIIFGVAGLVGIFFLLPLEKKGGFVPQRPTGQIDERKTMFSRRELLPGTTEYENFYTSKPQFKKTDDNFRAFPGLLNSRSSQFNAFNFASADASFETIEALYDKVDGSLNPEKVEVDAVQISKYIKAWARKLGALDCGITHLKDYHLYSYGGRRERRDKKYSREHEFAIAFTVEMDKQMVDTAPKAGIVMESGQQYLESGKISIQLAAFIRNLGYQARAHIDGNYEVVCPLVARDAGLGEIGRMGLLMTPKHGPRVRIGVVTANIPLSIDQPGDNFPVIDFCTICKKCADSCPSNAISFEDMEEIDGVLRWQINQEACFTLWCKLGTDCGRCMSVCPYSHENNALHSIVRTGINNNFVFRRIALKMDDVFYGRKPLSKEIPEQLNI